MSAHKHPQIETTPTEKQRVKNKTICIDPWDNIQPSNIDIIGVPESERDKEMMLFQILIEK